MRLAVLEELRASYGIKVKSGGCLAAAKQPGAAAAAEVRGRAVTLRPSGRAPPLLPGPGWAPPRGSAAAAAAAGAGPLSPARPGGHPVRHG